MAGGGGGTAQLHGPSKATLLLLHHGTMALVGWQHRSSASLGELGD